MFSYLKQKLLSLLVSIKSVYTDFNQAKREATSKIFQSLALASIVGGLMRIFSDADASNNWEVIIWFPCAIICYHISIMVLGPGDDK